VLRLFLFAFPDSRRFPALLFRRFELLEGIGCVIHFVEHEAADQDRRFLLDGHGDAVARARVQLNDFFLM